MFCNEPIGIRVWRGKSARQYGLALREVTVKAGQALWSPAQVHVGENIGTTDTRAIFVELKD